MLFNHKDRLFCPGPTPTPPAVAKVLDTNIYHRQPEFIRIFRRCRTKLTALCATEADAVLLSSSGTGAMEAAVLNFTAPHDQVLVIAGGKFGERFRELTRTYGCEVHDVVVPWGKSPNLAELETVLNSHRRKLKAVFMQAHETSTAVHYPVAKIASLVRRANPQCVIVVDAISSMFAHKLEIDDWSLDCVLVASQKAFGLPPGLACVLLSKHAQQNFSIRQRYYFDLALELASQQEGKPRFTPPTNLIVALDQTLDLLQEIGMEKLVHRHEVLADACRAAISALGLELFAKENPSNAVTSFLLPEPLNAQEVKKHLREKYRVQFAGGQGEKSTQMLRVSHLGFVDPFDLLAAISALEHTLQEFNHPVQIGAGTRAMSQKLGGH